MKEGEGIDEKTYRHDLWRWMMVWGCLKEGAGVCGRGHRGKN